MNEEEKPAPKPKKPRRGNNEGSIRQRKDGKWEARFTTGRLPNGKLKTKSIYSNSQAEVKARLKVALGEIVKGDYMDKCKILLKNWLDDWMQTYKKNSIRASTYSTHQNTIDCHIKTHDIGQIELYRLRPLDVQKFYNFKLQSLAPSTVKRLHVILKDALKQAVHCDMITKNPIDRVKPPSQVKPEIEIMTREQQKLFISALDGEWYRLAFLLALQSGLRLGELSALEWKDIDRDRKLLKVRQNVRRVDGKLLFQEPKTKTSKRKIPLLDSFIADLNSHEKRCEELKMKNRIAWGKNQYVFCTPYGQITEPRALTYEFKKILIKAKLPDFGFHSLRHTFATRLLESGENVKTVSELLGHTNVAFTLDTYFHVMPDTKTSAINIMSDIFKTESDETESDETSDNLKN